MKPSITPEEREQLRALDRRRKEIMARYRAEEKRRRKSQRVEKAGQEPRQKEPKYLQWIRRLPCVACECRAPGFRVIELGRNNIEAAHVRAGYPADGWRPTGMMEKPDDRRTVPLCRWHHQDGPDAQHKANERQWWEVRRIHPPALCAALSAAYDADQDGAEVIRRFAEEARRASL